MKSQWQYPIQSVGYRPCIAIHDLYNEFIGALTNPSRSDRCDGCSRRMQSGGAEGPGKPTWSIPKEMTMLAFFLLIMDVHHRFRPQQPRGIVMGNPIMLENIEDMRHREGIEDADLRNEIGGLGIGDLVKLTLLNGEASFAGETLLVRITSMKGSAFRGKLVEKPAFAGLSNLRAGSSLSFGSAHIHSIPKASRTG
jgi:hypothetical protein